MIFFVVLFSRCLGYTFDYAEYATRAKRFTTQKIVMPVLCFITSFRSAEMREINFILNDVFDYVV